MQDGITASVLFQQPDLSQELAKWAPSLDNDIDRQKQCIPLEMLHWFPIPRIHSGFPKTLLLHGEHDAAIPWQDSDVFSQALSAHSVDNRFVLVRGTGSGHGFDRGQGFGEFWDLYMAENLEWLFRTL
jgi:acetyl esterase/lipase